MALWDKRAQRVKIIDIAVPLDKNIQLIYTTKIQKYSQLKYEITEMWKVKSTTIHPIVISATRNVHVRWSTEGSWQSAHSANLEKLLELFKFLRGHK